MVAKFITRRTALKYVGLIAAVGQGWHAIETRAAMPAPQGYGADPDLLKRVVPWSRTLSARQLAMLATLCDVVLPVEPPHPSAQALNVHEFLDEWVSAPYPQMQADRTVVLIGLAALEAATHAEYGRSFTQTDWAQQVAAFDRICGRKKTAKFARRLIELICSGYYTTRQGHAAIGYVGNVPLATFSPPPPAVAQRLEQALSEL